MKIDNSSNEFAISLGKAQNHQHFLMFLLFIKGENPDNNYLHTFQNNFR